LVDRAERVYGYPVSRRIKTLFGSDFILYPGGGFVKAGMRGISGESLMLKQIRAFFTGCRRFLIDEILTGVV